jgi:hypothetical protein
MLRIHFNFKKTHRQTEATVSETTRGVSADHSKLLRSPPPSTRFATFEAITVSSFPLCFVYSSQLSLPFLSRHVTTIHFRTCTRVRASLFTAQFCHSSTFTVFVQLLIYLGFLPSFPDALARVTDITKVLSKLQVFWHTTPVDLQVTQLPVYSVY